MSFADWLIKRTTRRPPNYIIGMADSPYMLRWWVIPRNRFFNVYLHNIKRDDVDYALHDHPWMNLSIVLRGGYYEVMPESQPSPSRPQPPTRGVYRSPGSMVLRRATTAHRLMVSNADDVWSLFITGPVRRQWGFWCPKGWKSYLEVTQRTDNLSEPKGCGD